MIPLGADVRGGTTMLTFMITFNYSSASWARMPLLATTVLQR
jgi:hypothetical protein